MSARSAIMSIDVRSKPCSMNRASAACSIRLWVSRRLWNRASSRFVTCTGRSASMGEVRPAALHLRLALDEAPDAVGAAAHAVEVAAEAIGLRQAVDLQQHLEIARDLGLVAL